MSQSSWNLFVGKIYAEQFSLSQDDLNTFIALTGDKHFLHSNKDAAISCGFSDVIAHGALLIALSSKIIGMHMPGEHGVLISTSAEFIKPVYPNTKIFLCAECTSLKEKYGIATIKIEVYTEDIKNAVIKHIVMDNKRLQRS